MHLPLLPKKKAMKANTPKTATYTDATVRRKTIISFAVFIVMLCLGWWGWSRLYHTKPTAADPGIRPQLRKALKANEHIFGAVFSPHHYAKTFPNGTRTAPLKLNGTMGLSGSADTATWRLKVARKPGDTLYVSLNDLKALPKTDIIFDFKCIEGWSQVTHWGGVKVSDFIHHYGLDAIAEQSYMGLVTPDGGYYVGIDRGSALHPQTILCYEMNGQPLPQNQGAPLRLIIPTKYGIKHLKKIGTMYFSNIPPADYWAEQGYDYFAGL